VLNGQILVAANLGFNRFEGFRALAFSQAVRNSKNVLCDP
jgi:hypothetical protein